MKNCYILFIFALFLSISSCNNKSKENALKVEESEIVATTNRSIDSISVLFYNYLLESQTPIKSEDIKLNIPHFDKDRKGVLDAYIVDSTRIKDIKNRIDSLQPTNQTLPLDARLVAIIKYNDGKTDTLSIGGHSVNQIYLNGIQQQTDNQMLFLIKNYIGFYPWMIGDDMFAMKELQDNSFPKAPFISTTYYEAYQTALSKR